MPTKHEEKEIGHCMVCRSPVQELNGITHEAGCAHIHCGFGSDFDLLEFKGFVCDKCLDYLMRNKFFPECRNMLPSLGRNGPPEEFKPIDAHFEILKLCWAAREESEKGRKVNQDLLKKRDGKKPWEQ